MEAEKIAKETNIQAITNSILVAGVLIAGAIVYSSGGRAATPTGNAPVAKVSPITKADHILGSFDAPIKIVEYSDMECPFCKTFHKNLHAVVSEYGADKVAWVYRHNPIDSLHPKAEREAEATECAAELGGNAAFWKYIDRVFEITPANNGLDLAELPRIAEFTGLDVAKFNACLESGRTKGKVRLFKNDVDGFGTPHTVIIAGDDEVPVRGYVNVDVLKDIIDALL